MLIMYDSSNTTAHYRKDRNPAETIKKIASILSDIGINVIILTEHSYSNCWFSVQIQIENLPGITANGKGVTKDLALASAYAELMERLQSEQLLESYYEFSTLHNVELQFNNILFDKDSFTAIIKLYSNIVKIDTHETMLNKRPYYNVNANRYELLPGKLITYVCGSNGTCAGNSPAEALAQGMAEIAERFVLRKILHNGIDGMLELPTVCDEIISDKSSFKLLTAIREKGFLAYIKDCTIDGVFPVLGLLVINPNTSQYKFSIGCDFDVDICIQRCITEMFQGYDFGLLFRKRMLSLSETITANKKGTLSLLEPEKEFVNCAIDASGMLPLSTFMSESKTMQLSPFKVLKSNDEAFGLFRNLFKNQGAQIYICDYSYLGFPTFRIYIPKYSDIFYCNGEDALKSISMIEKLKNNFTKADNNNKINDIIHDLEYVKTLTRYHNNIPANRLHGLILTSSPETEKFEDSNMMYAVLLKKMKTHGKMVGVLENCMDKYLYDYWCAFSEFVSISEEQKNRLIMLFQLSMHHSSLEDVDLPQCELGCNDCSLDPICAYQFWKPVYSNIQQKKECFYQIKQFDSYLSDYFREEGKK